MFWLPWKHAPKLLVGPRHARSSRTASHGGGGFAFTSRKTAGAALHQVLRAHVAPTYPLYQPLFTPQNTPLLTNRWGMPQDRKGWAPPA